MSTSPAAVRIHHAGDRSVDGILRLIEIASGDAPLDVALREICEEIAAITGADVVSVYVREGDDALTMLGNHGFPAEAIGSVRLRVGEGLTGLCAECLRPVSVAVAAHEAGFKLVPGLGEERFPAYVGVPLIAGGRALGVLVLQRRERVVFSDAEVALATALGAPVTLGLERRLGRADQTRTARLDGVALVPGAAMGRVAVLPTLASLVDRGALDVIAALDRLPEELDRTIRRVRKSGDAEAIRAVDDVVLMISDGRLRERLAATPPTAPGLYAVARDYARAPFRVAAAQGATAVATARAGEIEDLLVVLYALANDDRLFPPGALWMSDRLGALVALVAGARDAGALVVEEEPLPAAVAIARAEGLPVVGAVRGLHAWARPGDRCAVHAPPRTEDGVLATATVRINPPVLAIEDARRRRAD
ncbi:MAG TPA: GAF domain-containing protein [Kofleriaceae bacterium]|nr:GAF domain-containing protein [Kofleriaceae bacterium]